MVLNSDPIRVSTLICIAWISTISISCYGQVADNSVQTLFDGETLNGWEGDPEYWSVKNGSIAGIIPHGQSLDHNTWLVWKGGQLDDFDLNMKVKLSGAADANSGIQYRCQVTDINHVSGYQADFDMGAVWLGRIYDEHGRALLVERGSRVLILPDGERRSEIFAPANEYAVLFRENEWNDYRVVAQGDHVAVFINGTLFSELVDQQIDEKDLRGSLALQLHSGPETKVEFKNIRLERLSENEHRLSMFDLSNDTAAEPETGTEQLDEDMGLGFESGDLAAWSATGDAFKGQPVNQDEIATRWGGATSNKNGDYFIGGYEVVGDSGTGTLTSKPVEVTHPYGSFLIGGGQADSTRVEIVSPAIGDVGEEVIFIATGTNQESMRRVAVDLREFVGKSILIRLVDENAGGWGHLNFDDFRFHQDRPMLVEPTTQWRSIHNPILQHLVQNKQQSVSPRRGDETTGRMHVPSGFSVEVIAAEPDLHQPMAFTFDAKGRLWVVEGYSYPQKRAAGEGLDRILIFSDTDENGTFETRQVFYEGLNLVSGMEVGHGGVWVGAAPQLLFIPDRDGDDRPDGDPQVMLDGFGFADTHETMNSFLWGPDGWLYGNQGVFNTSMIGKPGATIDQRESLSAGVWRYHPIKHEFEVYAYGGSNQWGLDYDEFGQMFMTHCRSYWGKGCTTHVIRGGHYWNQVNSGYAPFICSSAPGFQPAMRNFLLASARYGHGEGGAGKPGSKAVYGGHSHVGTMIYLGDNWPAEYHNHLFTHNLHGHQMNHQINVRESGGYNTVHAGYDVLFCEDQSYIGVDLKYGPDGAVYISDWYDPRHCHSPNWEQWDRGNGRLYRMKFDATYQPVAIDFTTATEEELVQAQLHANAWHARTARLELSHRHVTHPVDSEVISQLVNMATTHEDPTRRLNAIWTLHSLTAIDPQLTAKLLADSSEYVRGWAVQLGVETFSLTELNRLLVPLADQEPELFVRRYLASAIPQVPSELGWKIAEILGSQPENACDRELPQLLWYGVAKLMEQDLDHALRLADQTEIAVLKDYIFWYAAKLSDAGRHAIAERIVASTAEDQVHLLSLFELGLQGMRGLSTPSAWSQVSESFYDSQDASIRRAAQTLGATFGDNKLFQRMRQSLTVDKTFVSRQQALSILRNDVEGDNLPYLLPLLDSPQLAEQVLPMLTRFDEPLVADMILKRLPRWQDPLAAAAMGVLAGRVDWTLQLLDAIENGDLEKSRLTAFYAHQMANLGDDTLNRRLETIWGRLNPSSAERTAEIEELSHAYKTAPLWAYSDSAGAEHFKTLCANCHQNTAASDRIAPRLEGSGAKGIDYIIENVIDPNAVIGRDFQARIILNVDGRVVSGLVINETDSAYTIRTATDTETVAKQDVEETKVSENSFMPEGLLQTLNPRERIELFKFLMSL